MSSKATTLKLGFNALGFQSAWWLTVFGIVMGYPLVGPLAMTLYMIADHFSLTKQKAEMLLILTAMILGTVADSIFASTSFLSYAGGYTLAPFLAPLWITAMWGGFAATLNHSLGWIKTRPVLGFLLGGVFGPLSYIAGSKFGAIQFNAEMTTTVIVLGIFWGLAVPGLVKLHALIDRKLS
ncbi:MAG: DUF2878 domain-containing protein [Candidatus Marinimicrobia bacterium]|nr:DUF2878 domain-containing protein [Candidatus Neomarinimicrobiota bacterium]